MSIAAPQSTLAGPEICYQTLDRELSIETLTKPTVRGVLLTGLPGFLREGFLPLGAFYPFPGWFRQTEQFKRVYGVESVVWGVYMLLRSALRLAVLLQGGLESFLLVVLLTGTPIMLLLVAWSIRYAIRGLTPATAA